MLVWLNQDVTAGTNQTLNRAVNTSRSVTPLSRSSLQIVTMRASICDIVVAIAFGTIVYHPASAERDETSLYGYRDPTDIGPLERLRRLRGLADPLRRVAADIAKLPGW